MNFYYLRILSRKAGSVNFLLLEGMSAFDLQPNFSLEMIIDPPLRESPQNLCPCHRRLSGKSEGRKTRRKYSCKVQLGLGGKKWTSKYSLLACYTDPGIAPSALRCLGWAPCWSSGWGRGCKSPRWTHHSLRNGARVKKKTPLGNPEHLILSVNVLSV